MRTHNALLVVKGEKETPKSCTLLKERKVK